MTVVEDATTLIIPNWNGRLHLDVCLTSVGNQTRRPAQTILVDNGSSDDSLSFVAMRYPWVECVALPENRGFAAAVNTGIEMSTGSFVALLNNDTELDPGWLENMLRELHNDTTAGMAACKMLKFDARTTIDSAGDGLTRGGSPVTIGSGQPDGAAYNIRRYVTGTCAGAAVYRRELFRDVGLFDEDFVSYYEDMDLSLRAQLAGYKCVYVPSAVCFHKRGATSALLKDFPVKMQERNLTAVQIKNFPASVWLRRGPAIVGGRIRRLVREIRAGVGGAAIIGAVQGILAMPRTLRKRHQNLALRNVPPVYVQSLFGS
jgi:GT2 family glycosyltransferase